MANQDDFFGDEDYEAFFEDAGTGTGVGERLRSVERPLSIKERIANLGVYSGEAGAVTSEPFDKLVYNFHAQFTPNQLEKVHGSAEKIVLTLQNKGLSMPNYLTNSEDANPEIHRFGNCQVVKSVTLKLHNNMSEKRFNVHLPTITTLKSELINTGDHLGAPVPGGATLSKTVTNGTTVVLDRAIKQGTLNMAKVCPGMSAEMVDKTFRAHPRNPKHAYLQVDPISPLADFYNEHKDREGRNLKAITPELIEKAKRDFGGEVLLENAYDVVRDAAKETKALMENDIGYSNVIDPNKFAIEFSLPSSRVMDNRGVFREQKKSFKDAWHTEALAVPLPADSKTLASLKKNANDKEIILSGNVTIEYRTFVPNYEVVRD